MVHIRTNDFFYQLDGGSLLLRESRWVGIKHDPQIQRQRIGFTDHERCSPLSAIHDLYLIRVQVGNRGSSWIKRPDQNSFTDLGGRSAGTNRRRWGGSCRLDGSYGGSNDPLPCAGGTQQKQNRQKVFHRHLAP